MFAGDVSFARDIKEHAARRYGGNLSYVFAHVADQLRAADLAMVNLESVLWPSNQPLVDAGLDKAYVLQGLATGADALAAAGVDLVSIANNHIMVCSSW